MVFLGPRDPLVQPSISVCRPTRLSTRMFPSSSLFFSLFSSSFFSFSSPFFLSSSWLLFLLLLPLFSSFPSLQSKGLKDDYSCISSIFKHCDLMKVKEAAIARSLWQALKVISQLEQKSNISKQCQYFCWGQITSRQKLRNGFLTFLKCCRTFAFVLVIFTSLSVINES